QRRDARQQFSPVADRLLGDLGHRYALARFSPPRSPGGDCRVSEAGPPLRRHQGASGRARRQVTRVLSGAVLLIIAVAVVWFAPATLFVIIAEGLLVLACREFVDLARARGLHVPMTL